MKVLVNCDGELATFEVTESSTIGDLKQLIDENESYDKEIQRLYLGTEELCDDEITLEKSGIMDGSLVNMKISLLGGAGPVEYIDHLKEIAVKYRCNKMICRKCYARLPQNAHNCRKRKCGHCPNIRPKKKMKDKDGKK